MNLNLKIIKTNFDEYKDCVMSNLCNNDDLCVKDKDQSYANSNYQKWLKEMDFIDDIEIENLNN